MDSGLAALRRPGMTAKSELRGELVQAHDVGEIAHFVFLLGIEAHDQRDSRGFEIAYIDASAEATWVFAGVLRRCASRERV